MRTHFTYEAEPLEAYSDFELEFEINRSSRDYIKWVQSSLNRIIGARLVVDGISGSQTRAAVRTFQRQRGLTADGIVGPITEGALIAAGAGQPPGGAGGAPSSGTPGTGSPSSAIDTFLPYSGPGYESKYTSSDLRFNQYGRSEAILALQWIAREWQRKHPNGPKLYIGPISKKGGGTLCYSDGICHAEHKDGLDTDIRPVRNDQNKGGLKFTDPSYSRQLTQELVNLAWSNPCVPVEKILFNDPAVSRVNYSSGHDDHLHVSFKAPSGSLPAACRSTGTGYGWELSEELEQDWEEFLDDFGGAFTQPRIEDRTSFTPKDRRKGVRDIKKVHALVLHQMAFSRGNEPRRYDTVTAHFAILPDGKITQLHPETAVLWASNGFNACSVAVEFAGNFPNTKGKCWEAKQFGCHKLTPEQIEAGRYLVEYLIKKIGLTHIFAHRQAWDSRENCPGPDIWYNVGQWAVKKHGLKDGGPGFKIGSGHPIPDAWRTWGSIKKNPEIAWEISNEFDAG